MTVFSAFVETVARFPERPFLRAPVGSRCDYAPGAVEFTYKAAAEAVAKLRVGYTRLAVQPGQRVAVAFDNRLDVYLHLLALNSLGASIVPLNMMGANQEVSYVVAHSDAVLLTGAPEHIERFHSISAMLEDVRVVEGPAIDGNQEDIPVLGNAETEAALLYTSGTTGQPKGCILSNEYFLTMGREYNKLGGICRIDENDRLATPLPPYHMNALVTSFMAMLMCGGCVIQLDRFHPSTWWETVHEERATVIHYLGVMPAILLTMEPAEQGLAGQIRFGFGAGSDPRHQKVFEERFGFPLIEAWAMTESGGGGMIVANKEPRHLGKRCIGKPIDTMEYCIVDADGNRVSTGQDGELLVRAKGDNPRAGYFSAYYKDTVATETGWQNGWWHTGDIIHEGDDGSLYFVDRSKNVIRRSGENIAAIEVEAALLKNTLVDNCAVTAVPDEMRGDEVFAFIVTTSQGSGQQELVRQIFDAAMDSIAYFKVPGYIQLVDSLPLTGSNKVDRATIKRSARESVALGECIDLRALKQRRKFV